MSPCATAMLLFLAMAPNATITTAIAHSSAAELRLLSRALALVLRDRTWASTSAGSQDRYDQYDPACAVALRDCGKLYGESECRLSRMVGDVKGYTAEDALMWVSSVMTNHGTCVDGLRRKGCGFEANVLGTNITVTLRKVLASYAKDVGIAKGYNIQSKGYRIYNLQTKKLISRVVEIDENASWNWDEEKVERSNISIAIQKPQGIEEIKDKATEVPESPQETLLESSDAGLLASWSSGVSKADFTVAKDGSGTHKTITEAVTAVAAMVNSRPSRPVIYIKSGFYNEKVEIGVNLKNVLFVGDGIDKTIVTGNRNANQGYSTISSATFDASGDGFWARDMTFENTAGPRGEQAVALRVSSDLSVFYKCSFKGYQDTLLVDSNRQFFRDCHIYGTIDFIFGDASVVFQNCDIFLRKPLNNQANFITAQGRDDPNKPTGISIHSCQVKPSSEFSSSKDPIKSFLGRPWKEYSRTMFLKTNLDGLIDPKGWGEWNGDFALSTLYYGEYMNTGSGASTQHRVNWPGFHVLNNDNEATPFTVSQFLQGEKWIPATGVPFFSGI